MAKEPQVVITRQSKPQSHFSAMRQQESALRPVVKELPALNPDLRRLLRFVVGAAILGSRELAQQLRQTEQATGQASSVSSPGAPHAEGDRRLAYAALGLFVRTQIWSWQRVRQGVETSRSALSWFVRSADRMTSHPIFLPVRWPADRVMEQVNREIELAILLGQEIEEGSQELASDTITSLTDQVIAYISESPELAALVRSQVEQQGVGYAQTIVGAGRQRAMDADNLLENIVRRFLGRGDAAPDAEPASTRTRPQTPTSGTKSGTR